MRAVVCIPPDYAGLGECLVFGVCRGVVGDVFIRRVVVSGRGKRH